MKDNTKVGSCLPFTSHRLCGAREISVKKICWLLYGEPQDKPPGTQRFPVQNVRNLGAEHWGRVKDTGADHGTVRNGSNVYKLMLSLGKALTIPKKWIEFSRWYKLKWRDILIFWSLSMLKPQLIFSIRSTCKFLAVSCQGRRKSEKRPQNPLFWLLLLTTNLSFFSICNTHPILLALPDTLRLGRQFYTVPFWARNISQDSLESNEVK